MVAGPYFSTKLLSWGLLVMVVAFQAASSARQPVAGLAPSHQTVDGARFEEAKCRDVQSAYTSYWFSRRQFRCGYLHVRENYDSDTGRTIRLDVVITLRNRPNSLPKPAPIIYLDGGPGGHGFLWGPDTADKYAKHFGRDVIQFSQRGTLFSEPFLDCPHYRDMVVANWRKDLSAEQWQNRRKSALNDCWKRLSQQNAFDKSENYNSRFNALDVVKLITALGYDKAYLYGFSYGSLLAQHVLSLRADLVAGMVLDGVLPLGVEANSESESNADRALRRVFEDCSRNTDCREAYPDLEPFFDFLVEKLNDQPAAMTVRVGETTYQGVKLDGDAFSRALTGILAQPGKAGEIPRLVYAAGNGNFREIGQAHFQFELSPNFAWGMYYSVYCTEFAHFGTDVAFWSDVCSDYDPDDRSYGDVQASQTGVPILILSGIYDPLTPPDYGSQVAEALSVPSDYNLISPITAHSSGLGTSIEAYENCMMTITKTFFDHPDQSPPGADCWKQLQVENPGVIFNTVNPEIALHRLREWAQEQQQDFEDLLNSWQEQLKAWWEEQLRKIANELEKWARDLQQKVLEWMMQQLVTLLEQCLGGALLPAGLFGLVWGSRRLYCRQTSGDKH